MSSLTPDITDLEVSRKTVRVADGLEIELRYKDFYIIRTGACDFTGATARLDTTRMHEASAACDTSTI